MVGAEAEAAEEAAAGAAEEAAAAALEAAVAATVWHPSSDGSGEYAEPPPTRPGWNEYSPLMAQLRSGRLARQLRFSFGIMPPDPAPAPAPPHPAAGACTTPDDFETTAISTPRPPEPAPLPATKLEPALVPATKLEPALELETNPGSEPHQVLQQRAVPQPLSQPQQPAGPPRPAGPWRVPGRAKAD